MKHVSIQELDSAIESIWDSVNSIETPVPMADKTEWCKETREEVIEGVQQVFKCGDHYALVEHSYIPLRNEPCVFIVNPTCDKCRKSAETIADMRDVKWLGITQLDGNTLTVTTEKRV